jgi:quercetin dioxygenase-like cupin family protein
MKASDGHPLFGLQTMKHFKWDEIPAERLNDKFVRKLAWDGKMMVARTDVEQGCQVPAHSHDNEQITWVMSGKWRFRLEGRTVDVGPNEMISIPANVVHSAEAVETLVAYDIFTPPRQDWLAGEDAYLRETAR